MADESIKDKLSRQVKQSIKERTEFEMHNRPCPTCGGSATEDAPGISALGGPGHYWIEHICGSYSEMKATLEEAYTSTWVAVDPDLNAGMYPPVGGA